jgi:glutamate synthase domain-containing protein 1/glutamate synthase domain-containing protein 3
MCGIIGIYSLSFDVPGSLVLDALRAMRERGTPHGAGIALYRPGERVRIKAFSFKPIGKYIELPGGVYDAELDGEAHVDGFVYVKSKWIDVYKVVGWPDDLTAKYGVDKLRSRVWLGHTRYPTNSPGRMPYYSHPFTAGDVAIVHNGDLSSYGANINFIRYRTGAKFTGNDSEAIAYLLNELAREIGVDEAVEELMHGRRYRWARLDGPYAVAFMIGGPEPIFGAFVDPQHFRPLYLGLTGDLVVAASEAGAIKTIAPEAKVWALRGGEYVVVERGEVRGKFRRRYVYPDLPQPPPNAVDASLYDPVKLAGEVRRLLAEYGEVDVVNVRGHRYLGNGMEFGTIRAWGVVGNASANVMSGGAFFAYGDVQDDFGDAMNGGVAAIYGNAGDALGQAKRGGEIYVYGDAGTRAAIQHRGGVLVIGGSAGRYLGEYMGGGTVVVLRATNDEELGDRIAVGMVGGRIYIRGEVPKGHIGAPEAAKSERYLKSLFLDGLISEEEYRARMDGAQKGLRVEVRELAEGEIEALSPYIARFSSLFNIKININKEIFTIISSTGLAE